MPHLLYKSIQITSPFLIYHPYCLTFLVNPSRIPHPVIWQAHSFRGKILAKRLGSIYEFVYTNSYIDLYMYLCTGQAFRLEKLLPISRMNLVLLWLAFLGFIQNQEQYNDINPIVHCWGCRGMVFKHGRLCWSILLLRRCNEWRRRRWTGGGGIYTHKFNM